MPTPQTEAERAVQIEQYRSDFMVYGTGCLLVDETTGEVRCVPPSEWQAPGKRQTLVI